MTHSPGDNEPARGGYHFDCPEPVLARSLLRRLPQMTADTTSMTAHTHFRESEKAPNTMYTLDASRIQ